MLFFGPFPVTLMYLYDICKWEGLRKNTSLKFSNNSYHYCFANFITKAAFDLKLFYTLFNDVIMQWFFYKNVLNDDKR